MKKILLIIITGAIFFSCKQAKHSVTPSGKKYKVTFNVAGFNQKQTAFSINNRQAVNALSTDTLTNLRSYFDVLYYAAFNTGRPQTNQPLMQDSTMANMGTIVDSLPGGTYELYFWAGKKGLVTTNFGRSFDTRYTYNGPWQDTFWNTLSITIGTANVNKTITLNRVISKLRVKILDRIPANADSLIVSVHNDESYMLLDEAGIGGPDGDVVRNFAVKIPNAAKGQPNFTLERLMGNGLTFNVVITCKTASNNILGTATVNGAQSGSNLTTELTGNLFGTPLPNSQSFQVKIDTAWNATPINAGF